jgi:broad specificity phosphatase PhoE
MIELFFFRHGETDWNAERRFQGHTDIPLNARGREQAQALIEPLRAARIECVLSSDLSRAVDTARAVTEALSLPLHLHAGLREARLGAAEGRTMEELKELFGADTLARWRSPLHSDLDARYPGGESGEEVVARVLGALAHLVPADLRRIGVSTHGGVIRRLVHRALMASGRPIPQGESAWIHNGSLHLLHFEKESLKLTAPD